MAVKTLVKKTTQQNKNFSHLKKSPSQNRLWKVKR